ncbi:hypothetical protein GCM10027605_66160 [Micromonospora zhanjiangensis]
MFGGIAGALVLLLGIAAVVFVVRYVSDSPASALRGAADRIRSAPAVQVGVTYRDAGGHTINGQFTVTGDNLASGTVTDPLGGRADLVVGAGTSAVRGDADWWARRSPKQVRAITGQWVRPEPGVAFPFDIAAVLNPTALAKRVESLATAARRNDETTEDDDKVRTVVSGDWTALFDTGGDRKLRWLGGPLDPNLVTQPAAYHDNDDNRSAGVTPAHRTGPDTSGRSTVVAPARYDPIAIPPYVAITPEPTGSDAATGTQAAVAKVLPEASPAVPSGAVSAPSAPGPAAQRNVKPGYATFDLVSTAQDCNTPMCTWTVTVTNTGTAAGSGVLYASVTPGMPLVTFPVNLPVGGTFTTPPMTFPNPAPIIRGKNTQITITYTTWLFNPSFGHDPALPNRLATRGVNPNTLVQIDPGYMPSVLKLLDQMTSHVGAGDTTTGPNAVTAMDTAIRAGMLPELKTIAESGRLENPEDLTTKLKNVVQDTLPGSPDPVADKIGFRREVEQAAEILRQDPRARVVLDGAIRNPVTGELDGADVLDTVNKSAFQLKSVSSERLIHAIKIAINQLNGLRGVDVSSGIRQQAPPGTAR